VCACRSWGIGARQTASQRSTFDALMKELVAAVDESGGPFLAGADVSLVRPSPQTVLPALSSSGPFLAGAGVSLVFPSSQGLGTRCLFCLAGD
jgi:hypothetical protein